MPPTATPYDALNLYNESFGSENKLAELDKLIRAWLMAGDNKKLHETLALAQKQSLNHSQMLMEIITTITCNPIILNPTTQGLTNGLLFTIPLILLQHEKFNFEFTHIPVTNRIVDTLLQIYPALPLDTKILNYLYTHQELNHSLSSLHALGMALLAHETKQQLPHWSLLQGGATPQRLATKINVNNLTVQPRFLIGIAKLTRTTPLGDLFKPDVPTNQPGLALQAAITSAFKELTPYIKTIVKAPALFPSAYLESAFLSLLPHIAFVLDTTEKIQGEKLCMLSGSTNLVHAGFIDKKSSKIIAGFDVPVFLAEEYVPILLSKLENYLTNCGFETTIF